LLEQCGFWIDLGVHPPGDRGITAAERIKAMVTRRQAQVYLAGAAALVMLGGWRPFGKSKTAAPKETFEVTHTDEEWRKLLTPEQYAVLRKSQTERPYSSPLNDEKRPGTFSCAGCDLPVFSSTTKFESDTGWPSFWQPLDNAVGTSRDTTLRVVRTAVHCRRCGGHLGHLFDDGPPPTGMRYCMNGVAMTFKATTA
jgi:peptide-methionine (R)-S-oxide reductase